MPNQTDGGTDTDSPYVIGNTHPNTHPYATFETKQTAEYPNGKSGSGGGYERWRSYEHRPQTSRQGKEDVYVPAHRLHYLIHPSLADQPISDAVDELAGCDIHHRNGCRFDNRLENYELLDHGTHAEITNAQMRAYGEDAKQAATNPQPVENTCPGCGRHDVPTPARSPGFEGPRCIECAMQEADDHPIEVQSQ